MTIVIILHVTAMKITEGMIIGVKKGRTGIGRSVGTAKKGESRENRSQLMITEITVREGKEEEAVRATERVQ